MSKFGRLSGVPAGMESESDDDEFYERDYGFIACSKENFNGSLPDKPAVEVNGVQKESVGPTQSTASQNDPSIVEDQDSHWRQYQMNLNIAIPTDEFRMAIMRGNLAMVQSIVQQGFVVDTVMKSGWTGLMFACSCGESEIVDFLLEHKADPNFHRERFTPLMAACASSNEQEDKLLQCATSVIKCGGNVNSFERHHVTPLMFAAREGRSKIIKTLLEYNAEVDAVDNRGWTALVWAVSGGHTAVVRLLLEANATLKDIRGTGQTLIEFAYHQEQEIIAKLLEAFSKDKTLPDITDSQDDKKDNPIVTEAPFIPKKQENIQYGDLEVFLSGLKLAQLIPIFHAHELSFADVLHLSDEDLQKLGIHKMGSRRKILNGIRDVHRKEWEHSSLPSKDKLISCPDAVCMVANIGKHLSYISSTVSYLRNQIQAQPRILELGQEVNNVCMLIQRLDDAIKNNHNLHEELRFLKLHLDRIQDNVEYVPGDLIVERRTSKPDFSPRSRRGSIFAFSATVALLGIALVGTVVKKPVVLGRLLTWKI